MPTVTRGGRATSVSPLSTHYRSGTERGWEHFGGEINGIEKLTEDQGVFEYFFMSAYRESSAMRALASVPSSGLAGLAADRDDDGNRVVQLRTDPVGRNPAPVHTYVRSQQLPDPISPTRSGERGGELIR